LTESLFENAVVRILGTRYMVTTDAGVHVVGKDKRCHTCPDDGTICPAVYAVARYLKAGGQRAPDELPAPPRAKSRSLPACPICGAPVQADHTLDRAERGPGWRCTEGGYAHLYMHRYGHLKEWFCGAGAERHAIFLPDPVAAQPNIVSIPPFSPFVDRHQHIKNAA